MTERLEVIPGPMFSGKTDELIRSVVKEMYAGRNVQVFKPEIDVRYDEPDKIVSHNGKKLDAIRVKNSADLFYKVLPRTKLVAIDEVQFFDAGIVSVIESLQKKNIHVLVAGLPLDFRGEPFGQMPILLAKADNIISTHAVCDKKVLLFWTCGKEAIRTQRFVNGRPAKYTDPVVLVGAKEMYAARCVDHHEVPGRPNRK